MEFYVLENGEILGPFTRESLKARLEAGLFTSRQLGQESGSLHWTPLSKLLEGPDESEPASPWAGAQGRAGEFGEKCREAFQAFERRPAAIGIAALAGGCLFYLLSLVPVLLWVPWFAGALAASLLLIRAGRFVPGAGMMAAVVMLPAALIMNFGTDEKVPSAVFVAGNPPVPQPMEPAPVAAPFIAVKPMEPAPAVIEAPEPAPAIAATAPNEPPMVAAPPETAAPEKAPLKPREPWDEVAASTVPNSAAENAPVQPPVPAAPSGPDGTAMAAVVRPPPPVLAPSSNRAPADLPGVPVRSTAPEAVVDPGSGELIRESSNSLIFVDDSSGVTGSGFIGRINEKTYLFTNIHVVAGMKAPRFTRLDRQPIQLGGAAAAVAHDVMRYEGPALGKPLQIMEGIESKVLVGDEVVVLGNSQGAHVIMPLQGKVSGIGPNLVEVTAEFVPGNSGSPIIHKKTGQVIGIATYLIKRDLQWVSGNGGSTDAKDEKIRRFGYRIDSVAKWQGVAWPGFLAESLEVEKVHALTRDLARLLEDIGDDARVTPGRHQNPAMTRSVQTFLETSGRGRLSPRDRLQNVQRFLSDMRFASQGDLNLAKTHVNYDFFQRALSEEQDARNQFREIFDRLLKSTL